MPTAKIRILHVITGLSTGGAEMMLLKLLSAIDRDRYDCRVISLTNNGPIGAQISALGIPVISLGMRHGLPDPLGFIKLLKTLRKHQPDIVQTWLYHADLLGGLAAKMAGIPRVVWNIRHNNLAAGINKWHTRMTAQCCAWLSRWLADAIICNSRNSAVVHQAMGYETSLFHIIGNGFDLQRFTIDPVAKPVLCRELKLAPEALLVGLVARFDPQKDQCNFIAAARQIVSACPAARFIMVGKAIDDSNKILMDWINASGVAEHFHLLGERTDMPELMAAMDIVCSSSLGEGFPNAIGEAMSCGVPCVVTDVGDCADLLGDTGMVVPAADSRALAAAIIVLLQAGEAQRRQQGLLARQRIAEYYSLAAIVRQYEQLYSKLYAQH